MSEQVLAVGGGANLVQLSISGVALGAVYALVALSFAVVLKATGILNLLQGLLVMLGGFFTYQAHVRWGMPFWIAVAVAAVACVLVGLVTHYLLFSRVKSGGVTGLFAILLVGIGMLEIGEALVSTIWGADPLPIQDPWGLESWNVGGVIISQRNVWVVVISLVLLVAFWFLFQKSGLGVAMRAAASDPEAAAAQGISGRFVTGLAWSIAAVVAVLAGMMLSTAVGGGAVNTLDGVAFVALPALILGGVGSVGGSVLGGVILGLAQTYAAGYASSSLGSGFSQVVPFLVMIIILVIRPRGLFGSPEVVRA